MTKILLILPYFGKFPDIFPFWLQSVKNNPTINWILFTDNKLTNVPENLQVIQISFSKFSQLFSDYFPFEIKLNSPYKLCDYRVFYGEVLKDYTGGFEFWGFCDCDMIWGNIRNFVTEEMLENNNHLFGLGPFQLQRVNDPQYLEILRNTRAKGKYDYKYVYSNDINFTMDELPFGLPYQYYSQNKKLYYNEFSPDGRPYNAIHPEYYHFLDGFNSKNELGKAYKKTMYYQFKNIVDFWNRPIHKKVSLERNNLYRYTNGTFERLYTQDGKIRTQEIMYVHFYHRPLKICTDNKEMYFIVPNKIVEYNFNPSMFYMWRNGYKRLFDVRKLKQEHIKMKVKYEYNRITMKFKNLTN